MDPLSFIGYAAETEALSWAPMIVALMAWLSMWTFPGPHRLARRHYTKADRRRYSQ